MSNQNLKPGWKEWRFEQMAYEVKDRIDRPVDSGLERYVGLGHLDTGSLKIWRWGSTSDVEKQKLLFKKGDIIFGRRNAYLRRVAVADFDGVCSAHAMVLRAHEDVVLHEFLPFFMQTDRFWETALKVSAGSMSPTINWRNIAKEEFALPPLEEQNRIVDLLTTVEETSTLQQEALHSYEQIRRSILFSAFAGGGDVDHELLGKVKEITQIRLPQTWKFIPATELSSTLVTKGATPRNELTESDTDIPFIKVYNLTFDGSLDFSVKPTFVTVNGHRKLTRSIVYPGDVLMNIVGPPLGKVSIVPKGFPESNINQAIVRYRPLNSTIGKWLSWYLQSPWAQSWFHIRSKKTSGQRNLTLELCRKLPVPLPPEKELENVCNRIQAVETTDNILIKRSISTTNLRKTLVEQVLGAR